MALAWLLVLPAARALVAAPLARAPRARAAAAAGGELGFDEPIDRHRELVADVAGYERSRGTPLVRVGESKVPGAGRGVFAARDVRAGETLTEWVGLVAAPPQTHADEIELMYEYYGENWRDYSGRYEIGLAAPVDDGAGARAALNSATLAGEIARGGVVHESAREAAAVPTVALGADECDVELDARAAQEACAGGRVRLGDFVIYGKVAAMRATAKDGVAQLINDHSAIFAPEKRGSLLDDAGGARAAAKARADGRFRGGGMGSNAGKLSLADTGAAGLSGVSQISAATRAYLARARKRNNVAMVRARGVPRVFAVATRDVRAGEELFFTYGVGWWLAQLRRAALAQLAVCAPEPRRARALGDVVRSTEFVSLLHVDEERDVCGETGSMPRDYVFPLEPFPLDELFSEDADDWAQLMLREEFARVTECPVEGRLYMAAPESQNV